MHGLWERGKAKAPIGAFYQAALGKRDVAVLYLGWAGILLRTCDHTVALDLCDRNFHLNEAKELDRLDVHTYSHSHWDHWHAPTAVAIAAHTSAPMIVEPQILELGDISKREVIVAQAGKSIRIGQITLSPIAGIHPRPITLFHIEMPTVSVFHGADSGHVPLDRYHADLAIVPVGTPSPSCSPESAVAMIRDLGATAAIAVHGSEEDMHAFRELASQKIPEVEPCIPRAGELMVLSV